MITTKIARRLLLYIVLFSAAVTLILTSLQLWVDYQEDVENIESRLDQIGFTHSRSIAGNVWAVDKANLILQVRDIILLPDIEYAAIVEPNDEILVEHGLKEIVNPLTRHFLLEYPFEETNVFLGYLVVNATLDYAVLRLKERVLLILGTQALKTFLVSAFILFIVHRVVTRDLLSLTRHVRSATIETMGSPGTISELARRKDEIGTLYHAFIEMGDNVQREIWRRISLQEAAGRGLASVGTAIRCRRLGDADAVSIGHPVPEFLVNLLTSTSNSDEIESAFAQAQLRFRRIVASVGTEDANLARLERRFAYEVFFKSGDSWTITSVIIDGAIHTDIFVETSESNRLQAEILRAQKNDALGQLTGGIAHDFNNLLAIALGNAEVLEQKVSDRALQGNINAICLACRRGANLTNSLLSFARVAALEEGPVDINKIVSSTMHWSRRTLPASIHTEVILHSGLWSIWADAALTESALLNIILNARDAMPNGGKLTVETANCRIDADYIVAREETLLPGRYVMLAVTDTGHGISKEDLPNIFDPFFSTKEPGFGSGVGLSAVHGFLKQSSGTIRVYSEEGVGTTFKLYFPATESDRIDGAAKSEVEAEPTRGARLLVVEDEKALREILLYQLNAAGYDVYSASSGDDALNVANTMPEIDVVLTDIVMPGTLSGLKLVRILREKQPDIQVIYMSGYAQEAMVHGNGLGPEDIKLTKPIDRKALVQSIEAALETKLSST